MNVTVQTVQANCPGNPDRTHFWAMFENGRGCMFCEAWAAYPPRVETIDPLPTQFPAFHHDDPEYRPYGSSMATPDQINDLDVEIMARLLPLVDANKVTFMELQDIAVQIIELVRAAE